MSRFDRKTWGAVAVLLLAVVWAMSPNMSWSECRVQYGDKPGWRSYCHEQSEWGW